MVGCDAVIDRSRLQPGRKEQLPEEAEGFDQRYGTPYSRRFDQQQPDEEAKEEEPEEVDRMEGNEPNDFGGGGGGGFIGRPSPA